MYKKTKEEIIHDMCLTFRHDYSMPSIPENTVSIGGGMTESDKQYLYRRMKQIYENCIEEYIK